MPDTLQKMRVLYVGLMVCMLLYIRAIKFIPVPRYKSLNPAMYFALIFLAANTLVAGQILRYFSRRATVEKLRTDADDPKAVRRWRSGLMASGLMAEVLASFGFLVYISGATGRQAAPFFIAGAVALIIWCLGNPDFLGKESPLSMKPSRPFARIFISFFGI
jgi:hypothetical protein